MISNMAGRKEVNGNSGIYIVTIEGTELISTQSADNRVLGAHVNCEYCKVGKSVNFKSARYRYRRYFPNRHQLREIALVRIEECRQAERAVLQALEQYRIKRKRKLEWLSQITPEDAEKIALDALAEAGIDFQIPQL